MSTEREDPIISRYESARELVFGPRTEHVNGAGLAKEVKRRFLESELKTANELIYEYVEYAKGITEYRSPEENSANRQKLIWLLERLQEEVL